MSTPLVILGGGGHALVVAEAATRAGHAIAGFHDDRPEARLLHLPHLGPISALAPHTPFILAVGDVPTRARILAALAHDPDDATTIINPAAHLSRAPFAATLGPGTYLGPLAIVHSRATIGPHSIINSAAIVEHECDLGSNVHIAPGAILGGRVRVGPHTLVGLGARVLPNLTIGTNCIIAAGAIVTKDVPDNITVTGIPARQQT